MNFAKMAVIVLASWFGSAATELPNQRPSGRVPVLLELFTSEGCSSCPAADRLLENLDREQPVAGAELVVLSEHVDYWNHLGWSDPYSSAAYSERQRDYAGRLGADEVYTPQLVVDGRKQFVGSNRAAALNAIQEAAHTPKIAVTLRAVRKGSDVEVHVEAGGAESAAVYLVLALERAESSVSRGENAGRHLGHVSVAYSIKKIGMTSRDLGFQKDLRAGLKSGTTRVIVFLQEPKTRHVFGAARATA